MDACEFTVAHCIIGATRAFPQPKVHRSIARHLVREAAPAACTRIFYVLELSSKRDSGKSGAFEYNMSTLRRTGWQQMPPAGFIFDPPVPKLPAHPSYRDPRCWFGCVFMYEKARLCLGLVEEFELTARRRFDWITWSRPDLRWEHGAGLRMLSTLPRDAVFGMHDFLDMVLVSPRPLLEPLLDSVLRSCLLPEEAGRALTSACTDWVQSRATASGIRVVPLDIEYDIQRQTTGTRYSWAALTRWNLQVATMLRGKPLDVRVLGHDEEPGGDFSTDREPEHLAGCVTRIEASLCFNRAIALHGVQFLITRADAQEPLTTVLSCDVWRPVGSGRVQANTTTMHLFRKVIDLDVSQSRGITLHGRVEHSGVPVILKRGHCLGWTACSPGGPEPVRSLGPERGQLGTQEPAAGPPTALVRRQAELPGGRPAPLKTDLYGEFRPAEARRYGFSVHVQGLDL